MKSSHTILNLSSLLVIPIALASCAWLQSPTGKAVLSLGELAADLYAPQYAGVIGLAVNSLETPAGQPQTIPSVAQVQGVIASVTGTAPTDTKAATLAVAVLKTVQAASTPNAGLATAAAQINAAASPSL